MTAGLAIVALIIVGVLVARSIIVVPASTAAVIERWHNFRTVLGPGVQMIMPFVDTVRAKVDLREQVGSYPPQPVITQDNQVLSVELVVYFQVFDARAAVYEIEYYALAVEQLTTTALRNEIGRMSLEQVATERARLNARLRLVTDGGTQRWGIRVNRIDIKTIDHQPR